ncbi:protein grainyhead isoform X2 [Acyrthosiphon pisum]|uniref:Grh/CP2 DB domain-containing protein n=1 Tax=Acyrthosiphon pisum TaxID=7029 RepID=A0A8R2NMR8_ACYPI|nr:protein grainyhead isoform X2 [Acyrthosiphon pisum]
MSSAVDGQQQQQPLAGGSPPMAVVLTQHCCKEESSPGVSPPHPQTAMSPTTVQDMPPESTSPVMLATMQPVSVDEFQASDYHHQNHHQQQQHHHHQQQHQQHQQQHHHQQQPDDPLDQKTVIYIPGTDPQQTIIYDPQNPEGSLPPGITIQQDPANGSAVSVLVQGQAGHHQYLGASGTTVLVMQELVDDMGHILHRRRRGSCSEDDEVTGAVVDGDGQHHHRRRHNHHRDDGMADSDTNGGGGAGGGGGGGGGGGVAEQPAEPGGWRQSYYEHPLTAATSAMLNISGGASGDEQGQQSGQGQGQGGAPLSFVYEYYKLPHLSDSVKDKHLADIWPTTSSPNGSLLPSQLKPSNGLIGTGPGGLEIGAGHLGDLQGLFLHQQPLKREPEDLSHHRGGGPPNKGNNNADGLKTIGGRPKVVLVAPGNNGNQQDQQQQQLVVDVVNNNNNQQANNNNAVGGVKEEYGGGHHSPQHNSRSINGTPSSTSSLITEMNPPPPAIELIATPDGLKPMYGTHIFTTMTGQHADSGTPSPNSYEHQQYTTSSVLSGGGGAGNPGGYITTSGGRTPFADPYTYREYFGGASGGPEPGPYGSQIGAGGGGRQTASSYGGDASDPGAVSNAAATASFVERYVRQSSYHNKGVIAAAGLTVDLPSPDSGIGADAITPRDQNAIQQSFDYNEMCQTPSMLGEHQAQRTPTGGRSRPWHDFGRQNDADKIQIPKVFSNYGFRYYLESPISTNQRREDDRVTYINKGQFYGITMEYIPDPDKPLTSQTVKSVVMLMFREEKSPDDEIKAWQFWHGRQHSVKQRILDADTKNSAGLVGCIEEVSHNAIAIYWNPLESPAKINVAVQCLSTDFSSQKGVKGLPLHLQIDTYEEPRDGPVYHRGYCQIKVFCDKGAERKTRDEERRAAKRKMTATGRKKIDELYHPPCERSEFYSMSDLNKPPVLFSPAEDIDKLTSMELQGFYGHDTDTSSLSNGEPGSMKHSSPFLLHSGVANKPAGTTTTQTLKFHNHFPPDTHNVSYYNSEKKEVLDQSGLTTDGTVFSSPPNKRTKLQVPPINERVMLYVRQEAEDVYTPLHVIPPTTQGLLNAHGLFSDIFTFSLDYGQN